MFHFIYLMHLLFEMYLFACIGYIHYAILCTNVMKMPKCRDLGRPLEEEVHKDQREAVPPSFYLRCRAAEIVNHPQELQWRHRGEVPIFTRHRVSPLGRGREMMRVLRRRRVLAVMVMILCLMRTFALSRADLLWTQMMMTVAMMVMRIWRDMTILSFDGLIFLLIHLDTLGLRAYAFWGRMCLLIHFLYFSFCTWCFGSYIVLHSCVLSKSFPKERKDTNH